MTSFLNPHAGASGSQPEKGFKKRLMRVFSPRKLAGETCFMRCPDLTNQIMCALEGGSSPCPGHRPYRHAEDWVVTTASVGTGGRGLRRGH